MQKSFTHKTFLLFTLIFVLIAMASFAAFRETEQVGAGAKTCMKVAPAENGEMLWEVVSRRFLSLLSI